MIQDKGKTTIDQTRQGKTTKDKIGQQKTAKNPPPMVLLKLNFPSEWENARGSFPAVIAPVRLADPIYIY